MSFIVIGHNKGTDTYSVLDTSDLVVENISSNDFNKAKEYGFSFKHIDKSNSIFGISVSGSNYDIFIHDYPKPIYSGKFPDSCNRGDIFEHEIKVMDFGRVGNSLGVLVVCNCWCKYDIEVPMVMAQILKFPLKNIRKGVLGVYTSKPLNFVTKSIAKCQYMQCQGDYPDDCSIEQSYLKSNSVHGTCRLFGVEFGKDIPIYEDVCKKISYIKL